MFLRCYVLFYVTTCWVNAAIFTLIGEPNEGYLAIKTYFDYRPVCDLYWGAQNSKVVCRELGFRKHINTTSARLIDVNTPLSRYFYDHDVSCESSERKLSDCHAKRVKYFNIRRYCKETSYIYIKCDNIKEEDVLTIQDGYDIRLLNDKKQYGIISSGFLQISSTKKEENKDDGNKWFNVCADEWTEKNAIVACKNLGFPNVKSYQASVHNKVDIEYLHKTFYCTGNESTIHQCRRKQQDVCRKNEMVYLQCGQGDENEIITELNGEIRLRGGLFESEGRVEVFNGREWGSVCDDEWDIVDANVVCHQLGFGSAYEAVHWADQGEGVGKIMITNMNCTGNEQHLRECKYSTETTKCTHREDAGVRCRKPKYYYKQQVKLVGGKTPSEGRIEYLDKDSVWSSICGIGFSSNAGQVVCRQLGLGYVKWAGRSYKFGIQYRKGMFNVQCTGKEMELSECKYSDYDRCRYYDMASVICTQYAPDLLMDIHEFKKSILVESHYLYQLRCSYEEKCLAPDVNKIWTRGGYHKRHLMKFTSRFINKGTVAFRPHIDKSSWEYHKCHKHFHSMETFAYYDLIDINGVSVAVGQKASFCLEDSDCEAGFKKVYNCTDKGDQGITVNCADNYSNRIDCQWIDVTTLPYGNYSLRVDVNTWRNVSESDCLNNRAVCEIGYFGKDIEVRGCTTDPCYKESFGGNSFGHCCQFPFRYDGALHYKCIQNKDGRPWCATTHNYDEDEKWGFCTEKVMS